MRVLGRSSACSNAATSKEKLSDPTGVPPYDVAVTGGRIIDPETGLDARRNVGVSGQKIAIVSEDEITGHEMIDASGHVVCPDGNDR